MPHGPPEPVREPNEPVPATQFRSGRQKQSLNTIVFPVFLEYYWSRLIYIDLYGCICIYMFLYDFNCFSMNFKSFHSLWCMPQALFVPGEMPILDLSKYWLPWCMPQAFFSPGKCRSWICEPGFLERHKQQLKNSRPEVSRSCNRHEPWRGLQSRKSRITKNNTD